MSTPTVDPAVARLFIGLWPDDAVRDALAAQSDHWVWSKGARRVPHAKLHMTLHFLGAVPRERVAALTQAIAMPFDAFTLELDHAEVWPNDVAVVRSSTVPRALRTLHAQLHEALMRLAQPSARERFLPHVTLARKAHAAVPPANPTPIRWAVDGYALIESMPSSAYRVLHAYR